MNLIGIVGFIGSGKDTVANKFVDAGCKHDSFANPLKDVCASTFGWERALLEGDTTESREFRETPDIFWTRKTAIPNFTPRLALQLLGTDVMRNHFDPDIWLNSLEYRVKKLHNQNECVVISDCRFKNELELIRRVGGTTILVQRDDKPEWYDIALAANNGDAVAKHIMSKDFANIHLSEYEWIGSDIDFTINNNGTLEDLYANVDIVIEQLPQKPQIFNDNGLELV